MVYLCTYRSFLEDKSLTLLRTNEIPCANLEKPVIVAVVVANLTCFSEASGHFRLCLDTFSLNFERAFFIFEVLNID